MGSQQKDFPERFLNSVGKAVSRAVFLRDYSHFKIGGAADYFFKATVNKELVNAVRLAREYSIPFYIIGGGYNLLFDDEGFRGLIIKNEVKKIRRRDKREVEVSAGNSLDDLIRFATEKGLSGMEFMAGIPGTVGGAVFGNAGAFERSIGDLLLEATLLDKKGMQIVVDRNHFQFRYRHSVLKKKHDVLLSAVFGLEEGKKKEIKALVDRNLEIREEKHLPYDLACAGSYFKNPVLPDGRKVPAAYFLERVGAKKMKKGGAAVYPLHANFIINREKASAQDVLRLAQELKIRVKERFDVDLEEEVIFLPAEPLGF